MHTHRKFRMLQYASRTNKTTAVSSNVSTILVWVDGATIFVWFLLIVLPPVGYPKWVSEDVCCRYVEFGRRHSTNAVEMCKILMRSHLLFVTFLSFSLFFVETQTEFAFNCLYSIDYWVSFFQIEISWCCCCCCSLVWLFCISMRSHFTYSLLNNSYGWFESVPCGQPKVATTTIHRAEQARASKHNRNVTIISIIAIEIQ